ncbi:UNVERIFIED_CONTAM: hypothetical protein HDU68_005286 [Siphonaria sp. JEL0065]|nr:hypothetical protein HDU68_005286 [Siphonaria sp. JEL0065]
MTTASSLLKLVSGHLLTSSWLCRKARTPHHGTMPGASSSKLLVEWSKVQDSALQFCLLKVVTRLLKGAPPDFIPKYKLSTDLTLIKSNEDLRMYLYKFNAPNEPLETWPKTFQVKNLVYRVGKPQKTVADLKCTSKDSFWLDFNADYFSIAFDDQMKEQCESQLDYSKLVSFSVDHNGIRLTLMDPFNVSDSLTVASDGPYHVDLTWAPGFVMGGHNMNESQGSPSVKPNPSSFIQNYQTFSSSQRAPTSFVTSRNSIPGTNFAKQNEQEEADEYPASQSRHRSAVVKDTQDEAESPEMALNPNGFRQSAIAPAKQDEHFQHEDAIDDEEEGNEPASQILFGKQKHQKLHSQQKQQQHQMQSLTVDTCRRDSSFSPARSLLLSPPPDAATTKIVAPYYESSPVALKPIPHVVVVAATAVSTPKITKKYSSANNSHQKQQQKQRAHVTDDEEVEVQETVAVGASPPPPVRPEAATKQKTAAFKPVVGKKTSQMKKLAVVAEAEKDKDAEEKDEDLDEDEGEVMENLKVAVVEKGKRGRKSVAGGGAAKAKAKKSVAVVAEDGKVEGRRTRRSSTLAAAVAASVASSIITSVKDKEGAEEKKKRGGRNKESMPSKSDKEPVVAVQKESVANPKSTNALGAKRRRSVVGFVPLPESEDGSPEPEPLRVATKKPAKKGVKEVAYDAEEDEGKSSKPAIANTKAAADIKKTKLLSVNKPFAPPVRDSDEDQPPVGKRTSVKKSSVPPSVIAAPPSPRQQVDEEVLPEVVAVSLTKKSLAAVETQVTRKSASATFPIEPSAIVSRPDADDEDEEKSEEFPLGTQSVLDSFVQSLVNPTKELIASHTSATKGANIVKPIESAKTYSRVQKPALTLAPGDTAKTTGLSTSKHGLESTKSTTRYLDSEPSKSVKSSMKPIAGLVETAKLSVSHRRPMTDLVDTADESSMARTPTRLSQPQFLGGGGGGGPSSARRVAAASSQKDLTQLHDKSVEPMTRDNAVAPPSSKRKLTTITREDVDKSAKRRRGESSAVVQVREGEIQEEEDDFRCGDQEYEKYETPAAAIVQESKKRTGASTSKSSKSVLPWSKNRVVDVEETVWKGVQAPRSNSKQQTASIVKPLGKEVMEPKHNEEKEDREEKAIDEFVGVSVGSQRSGKSKRVSYTSVTQEFVSSPTSHPQFTLKRKMEMKVTHEHSQRKRRSSVSTPPLISEVSDIDSDVESAAAKLHQGSSRKKSELDPFVQTIADSIEKRVAATSSKISEKFTNLAISHVKFNPDEKINDHLTSRSELFTAMSERCRWEFKPTSLESAAAKVNETLL